MVTDDGTEEQDKQMLQDEELEERGGYSKDRLRKVQGGVLSIGSWGTRYAELPNRSSCQPVGPFPKWEGGYGLTASQWRFPSQTNSVVETSTNDN